MKPFTESFYAEAITIDVMQGLGDIFWVYQKFSPYFAKINFNILHQSEQPTETESRSIDWLKCFPKVDQVKMKYSCHMWPAWCTMADSINAWRSGHDVVYCCNSWIDNSVRLENIDPGSKIEWDIPLISEPCALPFSDYSLLYVSGPGHGPDNKTVWNVEVWVDLLKQIYQKYSKNWPAVIVGANFDRDVAYHLCDLVASAGIPSYAVIGQHPKHVIHIIKNTKFFLGFQCGLNIIADNFNIPQTMVYLPYFEKAIYCWCKKNNIETTCYETTFNQSVKHIVDNMKVNL